MVLHGVDHALHPVPALRLTLREQVEVGDLGRREELGGTVRARGHACAAADARSRVHGRVGDLLGHEDQVGVGRATRGRRDEPTCFDDVVERGAIGREVADHRERGGAPRLDGDLIAIGELAEEELAGRGAA